MDEAIKKTVLRMFTYGLYAVTAKHGDEMSVMTANWITQSWQNLGQTSRKA